MKKIGIYGGSFNPPHLGHVQAAQYALQKLGLSELLVIPAFVSPGKDAPAQTASAEQRMEMAGLALGKVQGVQVLDLELRRGGVSYTADTLESLRGLYPEDELVLLVGTDMFLSLQAWKDPERIFRQATVAVLYRGQKKEVEAVAAQKECLEAMGVRVILVENPVTEISSTDMRRLLTFRGAETFLDPAVAEYIRRLGLYGTGTSCKGLSEQELERKVLELLKPNRVAHVLGCRDTAVELARKWGADQTDAARAALLHDITKALDGPLQLTLCQAYGIILDNFSVQNPKTLHALTGSLVAERIFGENPAVVSAIRSHTTGKAGMNVLEKIIYVADYMEPNRDFPGVEELRKLAFSDLDAALKLGLEMTLDLLRREGKEIARDSIDALAFLQ